MIPNVERNQSLSGVANPVEWGSDVCSKRRAPNLPHVVWDADGRSLEPLLLISLPTAELSIFSKYEIPGWARPRFVTVLPHSGSAPGAQLREQGRP